MKINYLLLVLVIGVFGIGIMEFSLMGLLFVIACGVDVLIFVVGMLISVYVVGVMVGVLLMMFLFFYCVCCSVLIFLMVIFTFGNVFFVIVLDYMILMFLCILISLNYGVFFGLGLVVVVSVVLKYK